MSRASFDKYFDNNSYDYRLMKTTIEKKFPLNEPEKWFGYRNEANLQLPNMVCTHVMIAGRKLDTIDNEAFMQLYIEPLHDDVKSKIDPTKFQISSDSIIEEVRPGDNL